MPHQDALTEEVRKATVEPAKSIRWLHLSDLHFRGDEAWDRRTVVKALHRKAESLKDEGLAPDLVFVTGDVAWSGKRGEYEHAQRFFTQLGDVLGLKPRESFFVVPGNHDVDRAAHGRCPRRRAPKPGRRPPRPCASEDHGAARTAPDPLLHLHRALLLHGQRPWRVDEREVRGVRVGVV